MDVRTGEIIQKDTEETFKRFIATTSEAERKFFKRMAISPTQRQMSRKPPKVGRNEPCPCGSGKKFKKCCYLGQ